MELMLLPIFFCEPNGRKFVFSYAEPNPAHF